MMHTMTEQTLDVQAWFLAHAAYHKAVATYNARVRFIREKESEGHLGTFNAHGEYRLMTDAQKSALAADETLYHALAAHGEGENRE